MLNTWQQVSLPLIWPRVHGSSFSFQQRVGACSKIPQHDTTSAVHLQTVTIQLVLSTLVFSHDSVLTGKCMNS